MTLEKKRGSLQGWRYRNVFFVHFFSITYNSNVWTCWSTVYTFDSIFVHAVALAALVFCKVNTHTHFSQCKERFSCTRCIYLYFCYNWNKDPRNWVVGLVDGIVYSTPCLNIYISRPSEECLSSSHCACSVFFWRLNCTAWTRVGADCDAGSVVCCASGWLVVREDWKIESNRRK